MLLSTSIVISAILSTCIITTYSQLVFQSNILCNAEISNFIDQNETHYYRLTTFDTHNLTFHSCNSNIDIFITFFDRLGNDISNDSCIHGDWCGFCTYNNINTNYPENFTISAMEAGQYEIHISPYNLAGIYSFEVICDATCDYFSDAVHSIASGQNITSFMEIKNENIEITFDIEMNDYCDSSSCNVLYIGYDNIAYPSLSINGIANYVTLSVTNVYGYNDIYKIPNADKLLPVDNRTHSVNITITETLRVFAIDEKTLFTYYIFTDEDLLNKSINNDSYTLYISHPSHQSINASISNICIQKDENDVNDDAQYQNIQCGDFKNVTTSFTDDRYYYYFNISNDSTVVFDSCGSSFDTVLTLYHMNFSSLYEADDDAECGTNAVLTISKLLSGEYILGVSGYSNAYGRWQLYVSCNTLKDTRYKLLSNQDAQWITSEIYCRDTFGTSLATITTNTDIYDVLYTLFLNWDLLQLQYDEAEERYIDLWIGLYKDVANNSKWQWMDGTSCNYTATADCIDDVHWETNEPNSKSQKYQKVSLLRVYPYQIDPASDEYPVSLRDELFFTLSGKDTNYLLCNAPNGTYSEAKCKNKVNCWIEIDCCNDSIILSDIRDTDDEYWGVRPRIPSLFWKSNIFIIGMNLIHYTNIESIDISVTGHHYVREWEHVTYNEHNLSTDIYAQMHAQYDESVYLFATNRSTGEELLLGINLNNFKVNYTAVQSDLSLADFLYDQMNDGLQTDLLGCMVASANKVYLFRASQTLIYDLHLGQWTSSDFNGIVPSACAITNDELFIYIFGAFIVFKYDTVMDTVQYLETPNLCTLKQGSGITSRNDKIYMHGCYVGGWKTLVFDVNTENFELETINIANPIVPYMPWYPAGQLSIFDDNILLLLHSTRPDFPTATISDSKPKSVHLYYAVTDLVSVNFGDTAFNSSVWPSDGFIFRYYLNDFSESANSAYDIWLYSTNAKSNINASITLNISHDNCICDESGYKCNHCYQYFNLSNYLSVIDNDVDQLHFSAIPHHVEYNLTLMLPERITMDLERCVFYAFRLNAKTTNIQPFIEFSYNLSSNCYSRAGSIFSFDLTSSSTSANIYNKFTIDVVAYDSIICSICGIEDDAQDCVSCNDGRFNVYHDIMEQDTTLQLFFNSNAIDFAIEKNSFNVEYFNKLPFALDKWQIASIVAGSLLLLFIICGLTGFGYKTRKKYNNEAARRVKYAKDIRNPMVISIGIGCYERQPANRGINVVCKDLYGIDRDYQNMAKLCEVLKWKIYPEKEQFEWTQREIIDFIRERALQVSDSKTFDGIIAVISGHGYKNAIISSDYQLITKTAIHRLFSANFAAVREIPRIFVFDCCDGEQARSCFPADYDPNDEYEIKPNNTQTVVEDKGKNFDVDDIKIEQYDEEMWKKDQKNPDYLLSLIHAANEGFQAKMNSIDGSYLVYEFVKRMIDNVENNKNLFVGEIVDGIQQYLHDLGKQQITSVFNNNTRYLRFKQSDTDVNSGIDIGEQRN